MKGVATSSILSSAATALEPGDRFAIPFSSEVRSSGRVPIPENIQANGLVLEVVEDQNGQPLKVQVDAEENCLTDVFEAVQG